MSAGFLWVWFEHLHTFWRWHFNSGEQCPEQLLHFPSWVCRMLIEIRSVTLGLQSSVRAPPPTQSRIYTPHPGSRVLRHHSAFPAATVAAAPTHHVWSLLPQGLCTCWSTCPELPSLGLLLLISFSGLCLNITS